MAQYTVQAPDGKTVTLEGPDGASEADVIAQAQKLYNPQAAPRQSAGVPGVPKPPLPAGLQGSIPPHTRVVGGRILPTADAPVLGPGDAAVMPLGAGAAVAPLATALATAGGYAGGKAGGSIARYFHAPDPVERAAEIAGSIPGAMLGGRITGPLKTAAVGVTRSALGLPTSDSAEATLENTSGVRPATILGQARDAIKSASGRRQAAIDASTANPSLQPALDVLNKEANRVGEGQGDYGYVDNLRKTLTEPTPRFKGKVEYPQGANTPIYAQPTASAVLGPNGQPLPGLPSITSGASPPLQVATEQDPRTFLKIRQLFGEQKTKFDPGRPLPRPALSAGNDAYMALRNELQSKVPGVIEPDTLIHNLLPAVSRTRILANAPGPVENVLGRVGMKTGAMALPALGYATGGKEGLGLSMAAQEMLSNPTGRMAIARALKSAGRTLPAGKSAAVGLATQRQQ